MSNQEQGQAMQSSNIPSLPQLVTQDTSEGSLGGLHTTGGGESTSQALAEMEMRVQERASAVQSQASELQELEARLQAAERRKQELEAQAIRT